MNRIAAFASLGIGLVGFGFFYQLFDQIIIRYISIYVRPSVYNTGEVFLWEILPWFAIIIGAIFIVAAGMSARATTTKGGDSQ